MRARLSILFLTVGVLLVGACGTDEAGEVTSVGGGSSTDDETSTTEAEDGGDDADGETDDGDGSATTETTEAAQGEVVLDGEPFDIGPGEGDQLDVVGVAHDDELNFRQLPDPSSAIVDAVAPQASSPVVLSQGEGRLLTRSAWWHVTVDGQDAWANFTFLGMLGRTSDVYDELAEQLGVVEEDSLDDLVDAIAAVRGSDGPEPTVTYVTDPDIGSGQQDVVIDIVGYGDDALKGERFTLTVTDATSSGSGVGLVGAEATIICSRGLSGDACV